jgi:hypothetical protein
MRSAVPGLGGQDELREVSMKQSKAWVMATLGVLALSACGSPKNAPVTTNTTTIDDTTNGGGDGGNGGNGGSISRIPTGPTGPLSGNVNFDQLTKSNAALLRGIINSISAGNGPASIIGGLAALGKAFSHDLDVGTRSCDAGGHFTSHSTGGDDDGDGIPVSAVVTFDNCAYTFTTNGKSGKVYLNGKLELEDHNPNADDNSFFFLAGLNVTGKGAVDLGGTVIDINGSAKLNFGLDVMNKSNSYEIALGADLTIDGKTLAARLDAKVTPKNVHNYGAGGALALSGKVGLSQPGTDTVVGISSDGLTYDENCSSSINHGSLTATDGVHNLVITQVKCGYTSAKVDGHYIDL